MKDDYKKHTESGQSVNKKEVARLNRTDCVSKAEEVVLSYINDVKDSKNRISSTKIRALLNMVNDIIGNAAGMASIKKSSSLSEDIQSKILYTRMRFSYEAGREDKNRRFIEKANILDHLKMIGEDSEYLMIFCRYMESLIGFYKYYSDN